MTKRAFAIGAHPDDIEFMIAGTLILLNQSGYEIHYMTLANGCCGTNQYDIKTTARIRRQESINAAEFARAIYHESLAKDIEIFYEKKNLERLGSIIREVAPEIILTHSIQEYMEDHMNTTRLVLTAAFTRGMPNFMVDPPRSPVDLPVTIYHSLPYGLRDSLRKLVRPGMYVNISSMMQAKREMLTMHKSQKKWLDSNQGIDSFLITMEKMCKDVGSMSGRYDYAEGWTRHLPLGYCDEKADPLYRDLPNKSFVDETFEQELG